MAEIKLELPDLASTAMGKAVLAALGKEGEEKIIQACIHHLTTPKGGYHDRERNTPLMDIVFDEARKVARGLLEVRLADDEVFKTEVAKLYTDAMAKFFEGDKRQKLVDKMANRLEAAFSDDRY